MQILGLFLHGMSYRPTDLSLLKGVWEFPNFEYDCNLPSEYTVQSNFSSPRLITCFQNIYNLCFRVQNIEKGTNQNNTH